MIGRNIGVIEETYLALGHSWVLVDVVAKEFVQVHLVSDHEVEDVVRPLARRLVSHARLFQKVSLNITTGHLALVVEPDTDELSLKW